MNIQRLSFHSVVLFFLLSSCCVTKPTGRNKNYSPYDFGLSRAKTGIERYDVLLRTHQAALAAGVNVDYTGIKNIDIEIPEKFTTIPLTANNDFKGCVISVTNRQKTVCLFSTLRKGEPVTVGKKAIDAGDFRSVAELASGEKLLIIEDENPWVQNRSGHSYGHVRKEILLVRNGKAVNNVTMPYNNAFSSPKCTYITLNDTPLVVKNLTVRRKEGCSQIARVFNISGYDNVQLENIQVITPENKLKGDAAISITDCTNVTLSDVSILGTYSQIDASGYGISMNNIWNFKATRLVGKGNWGVFGNNNINSATIEDSQINRFDIHCYGRDVAFKNVDFFDRYNQFASVFGTISFDKCTFTDFIPVLNGSSYNSYVAYDVVMKDCVFNATPKNNFIFRISGLSKTVNTRSELKEKCWPNVRIKNLTVNMMDGANSFSLFYNKTDSKQLPVLHYLSTVDIDGLTVIEDNEKSFKGLILSNLEVKTTKPVECTIRNVEVRPAGVTVKSSEVSSKAIVLKANMPLKEGKAKLKNASVLKQ